MGEFRKIPSEIGAGKTEEEMAVKMCHFLSADQACIRTTALDAIPRIGMSTAFLIGVRKS